MIFSLFLLLSRDLFHFSRLIDLIVFMDEEGFVPDHHIRHALIRSLTYQQDLSSGSNLEPAVTTISNESTEEVLDSTIALALALQSLPPPSATKSKPSSLTAANANINGVVRKSMISPTEIWTFLNWQSLRRTVSTVVGRLQIAPQIGGAPRFSEITESRIATMFFGTNSSSNNTTYLNTSTSHVNTSIDIQSLNNNQKQPKDQILSPTSRHNLRTSYGGLIPTQKDRWTANILEGSIPVLFWNKREQQLVCGHNGSQTAESSGLRKDGGVEAISSSSKKRYRSFAASKRLYRQVAIGEEWLLKIVPNVAIDLTHSSGMVCASSTCPIQRPLTLQEIYQGWMEGSAGDNNKYTTHCIYCQHEFIPRFCIQHISDEDIGEGQGKKEDDEGERDHAIEKRDDTEHRPRQYSRTRKQSDESDEKNSGYLSSGSEETLSTQTKDETCSPATYSENAAHTKKSSIWCELLSPWTLHKEMLNVIFEEGISQLLSQHFKSRTHQSEVIFWNAVLSFRFRGLPIAFLLTNKNIAQAFPYASKTSSS